MIARVNGTDLYYEYYQNDRAEKTLVLVHGFLSSGFSFRRLIPLLQKHYSLINIDLPPFGKSGKSKEYIYSYDNMAKTVIELLEKLGIHHASMIGHSMGGQICLHVSYLRPDLIESIVLLCSSSYLKPSKQSLVALSYLPFAYLFVKLHLMRSGLRRNLETVVFDQKMIDEEMMNGYLQPFLEQDIFRALTRMIRDHKGDLSVDQLKEIDTSCLLIWGDHDRVVPLSVGRRLDSDLPHSRLVVLRDTGHLVPEERPEEVFGHIRKFLEEYT